MIQAAGRQLSADNPLMTPRRAFFLLGLAAALVLGVALRLSTRAQLSAGSRVHALTVDDHYHLRRARFAVARYPRTILFDPLMNFPQGGVPIWPPLFDVALATPARLLHGSGASADAIERGAAWVPIFFASGAILFAGLLGAEILGPLAGVVVACFVAVCPGHILWTQYGHTDQHVAESFFGLLVLWLFVASRNRALPERESGAMPWEAATGVALALATLAWQGAIYWGAIFALSLFLEAVRTRASVFRAAALVLGLSAVLVAAATTLWLGDFRPPLTYISFGFFQPLFLAALAGGTILLDTLLAARRGRLSRAEMLARAAAMILAALAILPQARGLALGFARGVSYVVGETGGEIAGSGGYLSYPKNWLKGIFEARPLFAEGAGLAVAQLSFAFFLIPLAILLWGLRARRGERPGVSIALAVWGAVTLLLALAQRMNVYYAAPLAAVTLVEAARTGSARLVRRPQGRALAAVAIGLALASPFAWSTPAEVHTVRVAGSDLYATLDWMRRELPHAVDAYDPRLLQVPVGSPQLQKAASVLAPWSLGHLILYESELPVVANNFGYGFADSIRFFLAETEQEGLSIARGRRARWIVVTDLVPRLNDYAGCVGLAAPLQVTERGLVPTDRYFRTLQSRLYDFDGAGLETAGLKVPPLQHFRLRFHSSSAIRRSGRWIARWKVFEVN
jgi:asparagine N-glycosylation enzyme membrane subunit Stt3